MKNIKRLFLILALCFSSFFLFALDCDRVLFGTGNDKFSMGISKNDDDFKTYDFPLSVEMTHCDKLKSTVDFAITSFTDRKQGTRHDELIADYSVSYTPVSTDYFAINITPSAGFFFSGDLGMDFVQNIHHKRVHVKPVDLAYEENLAKMAWGGNLKA